MSQRIIVISEDLAEPWDEGIKKFTYSVGASLQGDHDVLIVNVDRSDVGDCATTHRVPGTKSFVSSSLRRTIRRFDPDAIVYVPSPSATVSSFARCFVLRRHQPRALIGMVGLMPRAHPGWTRPFIHATQPDITLVASYKSLLHMSNLSVNADTVPVGVDLDTFRPARTDEKQVLRERYDVPAGAYVYLHIGHLSPHRNLEVLGVLAAQPNTEVIVIGSTSTLADQAVRGALEAAGVRVIREFMPVDEFYRLADCYVFPVHDAIGCVEIPLSVLEALASGIPVLARPFGGLRDFFPAGADLRYWNDEDELSVFAAALRVNGPPRNRDMRPFAWRRIADRILFAMENAGRQGAR
jgi:glycosyltransferase involved in cell wall biosynthesis